MSGLKSCRRGERRSDKGSSVNVGWRHRLYADYPLFIVGLYGVLSFRVAQRTREIGIRLALGAEPLRVISLVLSEIGAMTMSGLVLGAVGAALAGRFVSTLLFEVKPSDLWILALLTCLLAACALSGLVPALRAIRIDPTTALRSE